MRKGLIYLILAVFLVVILGSAAMAIGEGDMLPGFTVKDAQGKDFKSADLKGQYVVYLMWDVKGPSTSSISAFRDNLDKLTQLGIKVVAIGANMTKDSAAGYAQREKLAFTVLGDGDGKIQKLWDINGIPCIIVVNPAGKIIFFDKGFSNFHTWYRNIAGVVGYDKLKTEERMVGYAIPNLKAGSYVTKPVQFDYDTLAKTMKIDFLTEHYTNFTRRATVKLVNEPQYAGLPYYGAINFAGKSYTIAALDTQNDHVMDIFYVDFNGNLDLTDDGEPLKPKVVSKYFETPFQLNVKTDTSTMVLNVICHSWELENMYYFENTSALEVKVGTGGDPIKAMLIDADANGVYGDPADVVLIDLNGNGVFDYSDAQEAVRLDSTLQLGKFNINFEVIEGGKFLVLKKTVK